MYPGNTTSSYKDCSMHPEVSLKMWMSCCDQSCSGLGSTAENDNNLRFFSAQIPHLKLQISENADPTIFTKTSKNRGSPASLNLGSSEMREKSGARVGVSSVSAETKKFGAQPIEIAPNLKSKILPIYYYVSIISFIF